MTLGESREFLFLRKAGTDEFYSAPTFTTTDLLQAARFTASDPGRDALDILLTNIRQACIQSEGKTSAVDIVRVRITMEQL